MCLTGFLKESPSLLASLLINLNQIPHYGPQNTVIQKFHKGWQNLINWGADLNISFVIPVKFIMLAGIDLHGLTKELNLSIISLFNIFMAPISIISSPSKQRPVVSISTITKLRQI